MRPRVLGFLACLSLGATVVSCEGFINEEIGRGIGTSCRDDDDCQASQCINGTCTIECAAAGDCPSPTACTDAGICEVPLYAGFVFVGSVDQEAWSRSHDLGRQAVEPLSYLTTSLNDQNSFPNDVVAAMDELIGVGHQVIVVNRSTMLPTVVQRAEQSPGVRFWVNGFGRGDVPFNVTSYDVRAYQGYYLAGVAAGLYLEQLVELDQTIVPRIGIVGSYVTPSVVAMVNAFHLGARSMFDAVTTEVRWVEDWHDPGDPIDGVSLEARLTDELLDAGALVIAHTVDSNIPMLVASENGGSNVRAIGSHLPTACQAAEGATIIPRCLGVVSYNWAPLYAGMFDATHAGQFLGAQILDGIRVNPNESVVNFDLVGGSNQEAVGNEIDGVLSELANDQRFVFQGPIASTGQCGELDVETDTYPCVSEGDTLGGDGLQNMCWLAAGIFEGVDASDPPAPIPALVPESGDCTPPPVE